MSIISSVKSAISNTFNKITGKETTKVPIYTGSSTPSASTSTGGYSVGSATGGGVQYGASGEVEKIFNKSGNVVYSSGGSASSPKPISAADTSGGYDVSTKSNVNASANQTTTKPFTNQTITQQNASYNPNISTLTARKSFGQRYKETIQNKGIVTGSLSFLGSDVLGRGYDVFAQKTKQNYQFQPIVNLANVIPQASYFTPAGPVLAIASGTESLVSPYGKQNIADIKTGLAQKGYGSTIQNVAAYSTPIATTGLGVLGLRSQVGSFNAARELKMIETAPIKVSGYRIETQTGGIDLLKATQETSRTTSIGKLMQPYYKVGDSGFTLEAGKGSVFTFSKVKSNLAGMSFESSGRGMTLVSTPKLTSVSSGLKITKEMEGAVGSVGRFNIKPLSEVNLKYTKSPTLSGDFRVDAFGKIKPSSMPKTSKSFIGISKDVDNMLVSMSGKPLKARLTFDTGDVSLMAKPTNYGLVKRIKVGDFGSDISSSFKSSGITKTMGTKLQPSYSQELFRTAFKSQLPQVTKFSSGSFGGLASLTKQNYRTGLSIMQIPQISTKPKSNQGSILLSMPSTEQITRTRQSTAGISLVLPRTSTSTRQTPDSFLGSASITGSASKQTPRLATPTFTIPFSIQTPRITTPFIPIIPSFSFGDFGKSLNRKFKSKPRYKYTPSYESLIFNIRGKAPKPSKLFGYAGKSRPIPKNFSWAYGKYKMPSFNSFNSLLNFGRRRKKRR